MKINWRAGLLIILLAVPAFLFLFLFFFGENEFDLPYKFPVAVEDKSSQQLLDEKYSNPGYSSLTNSIKRPLTGGDTLYLVFDPKQRDSRRPYVMVVYYNEIAGEPDYNQNAELERLEEKFENQSRVRLLKMYEEDQLSTYWLKLFSFIKASYPKDYQDDGILLLIDENGYFRGVYDPSVKSDIDRLVTEYQIVLKF